MRATDTLTALIFHLARTSTGSLFYQKGTISNLSKLCKCSFWTELWNGSFGGMLFMFCQSNPEWQCANDNNCNHALFTSTKAKGHLSRKGVCWIRCVIESLVSILALVSWPFTRGSNVNFKDKGEMHLNYVCLAWCGHGNELSSLFFPSNKQNKKLKSGVKLQELHHTSQGSVETSCDTDSCYTLVKISNEPPDIFVTCVSDEFAVNSTLLET